LHRCPSIQKKESEFFKHVAVGSYARPAASLHADPTSDEFVIFVYAFHESYITYVILVQGNEIFPKSKCIS